MRRTPGALGRAAPSFIAYNLEQRLRRGAAFVRLAAQDAEVHKTLAEANALLKPHGALREPTLEELRKALALSQE
jgi:hypothetical protein